jgi:argininosuccinate lyase
MKLWQKTNSTLDARIEQFTVGQDRELDLLLAPYDVQGSLAHIQMLSEVGLLEVTEYEQLRVALQAIFTDIERGDFRIEEGIEDVHSQIEYLLTQRLGDLGKKIHSARSRNDQVLVDLRLFFRAELKIIQAKTVALTELLLEKSEANKKVLMPGYTHLQVAMMSSFGLWFGGYAETLIDDLQLLKSVQAIVNQNPLGSAAGYGSSLPINRKRTTELLGFQDLNYNVIHAQMGRGKTEQFISFSFAALATTLGKLAMDVCLFMSQNFNFVALPSNLTTGSSIMPHKKNPDVFELLRGKCNRLQTLPQEISMLISNLPSGYHRDYQLLKEIIFPAIETLKSCLDIAHYGISELVVQQGIVEDKKYNYLYSVEEVNRLVQSGVPFRDAYKMVGDSIENGTFDPQTAIIHTHEGSIGNLCTAEIRAKLEQVVAQQLD